MELILGFMSAQDIQWFYSKMTDMFTTFQDEICREFIQFQMQVPLQHPPVL
jgi:hypothetical protein